MVEVPATVQLVAMDRSHLAATLEWLQDEELRHRLDTLGTPTPTGNTAYWETRWADPTAESYAIVDTGGEHVGNGGLVDIDLRRRKAEIWAYVPRARGRGLGAAAFTAILDRAFLQLGLHRVYLRVLAHNVDALRFLSRVGFVVEGRARADTWWNDQPVDSTFMSILTDEYAARSGATD